MINILIHFNKMIYAEMILKKNEILIEKLHQ